MTKRPALYRSLIVILSASWLIFGALGCGIHVDPAMTDEEMLESATLDYNQAISDMKHPKSPADFKDAVDRRHNAKVRLNEIRASMKRDP